MSEYWDSEMVPFHTVIMRGGTSKGIFFRENDLPVEQSARDKVILAAFGSPDPRQIDGLGGADPLTSKLAIIGPSTRDDADIDYTFGQVDIHAPFVDYGSNCGNISTAVGPYAILQGLVRAQAPVTKVRIHNTNTGKILVAEVPVLNGRPKVEGDFILSGVPHPGAPIVLDFAGTAGSKTGKLLPTGNVKDTFYIDGVGTLTVSLVDAASPMVFVRAEDLGMQGTESAQTIDGNKELLEKLERIRGHAAQVMGLVSDWREARDTMKAVPMVAMVAPPQTYVSALSGNTINAEDIDFVSRGLFMFIVHKTYSATASVCTCAAAKIPGTVVNDVFRKDKKDNSVRVGHPGGTIQVETVVERQDGEYALKRAGVNRTARLIMEGTVYVPKKYLL